MFTEAVMRLVDAAEGSFHMAEGVIRAKLKTKADVRDVKWWRETYLDKYVNLLDRDCAEAFVFLTDALPEAEERPSAAGEARKRGEECTFFEEVQRYAKAIVLRDQAVSLDCALEEGAATLRGLHLLGDLERPMIKRLLDRLVTDQGYQSMVIRVQADIVRGTTTSRKCTGDEISPNAVIRVLCLAATMERKTRSLPEYEFQLPAAEFLLALIAAIKSTSKSKVVANDVFKRLADARDVFVDEGIQGMLCGMLEDARKAGTNESDTLTAMRSWTGKAWTDKHMGRAAPAVAHKKDAVVPHTDSRETERRQTVMNTSRWAPDRTERKEKRPIVCFNCRETGHFQVDCPKDRPSTAPTSARKRLVFKSPANVVRTEEKEATSGA